MPFILRLIIMSQVPLDDIYVGLWYIMLCVQNGRWYFKQVHFYSVFLSICYIAQNQCVSFHTVLQWFIFLQGLRVSKHTVFPVRKLNTSSPKLLLAYWDPCDIGGGLSNIEYSALAVALFALTIECWSGFVLFFLTLCQPFLQHR